MSAAVRKTIDKEAEILLKYILFKENQFMDTLWNIWKNTAAPAEYKLALMNKAYMSFYNTIDKEAQAIVSKSMTTILKRMDDWGTITPEMLSALSHIGASKIMVAGKGLTNHWNNVIQRGVMLGQDEGTIRKLLKEKTGELDHHIRTEVNTALNTYSRSVNYEMAKNDTALRKYRYEGPVDGKTRPFCLDMVEAGDLNMGAIEERFGGAFIEGGGYNCRHQWVPVDIAEPSLQKKAEQLKAEKTTASKADVKPTTKPKTVAKPKTKADNLGIKPADLDAGVQEYKDTYDAASNYWLNTASNSQRMAVDVYTSSGYLRINEAARQIEKYGRDAIAWDDLQYINDITKSLAKAPKHKGTVYRGMEIAGIDDYNILADIYKKNKVIKSNQFISTSANYNVGADFARIDQAVHSVLVKIEGKTGVNLDGLGMGGEAEILYNIGTKFEIVSVTETQKALEGKMWSKLEVIMREI